MKFGRSYRWLRNKAGLYLSLFRDKRTPLVSKVLLIVALLYLVWPFDLIPDFIPFAGFVDELIIIPVLFYLATMFVPKDVMNEHMTKSSRKFKNAIEGEIVD